MNDTVENKRVLLEIKELQDGFDFYSSIEKAMEQTNLDLELLHETVDSVKGLKNEADKVDYMLAASAGALSGIIDIFLVGKPGETPIGKVTDEWFANRTKDFARMVGWTGGNSDSLSSAIRHLEKRFDIPYDQTGAGDIGADIFGLTPTNHHYKSLAHNPSLLGLFYSILNQFQNTSSFVTDGQLITLRQADNTFELVGHNITSKLFAAFSNWIGHLMSDISGSSSSKGRGMGIPSPLWTWINSVTAIKRKLRIPASTFDRSMNELAVQLFNQGYDIRFQAAQAVPVFVNEMLVRFLYSTRRMIHYFSTLESENYSFKAMWESIQPFTHPTVKRMLTVAHGTFCLVDLSEATLQGYSKGLGIFQPVEFFLRLNLVGIGRLTISLYGEEQRAMNNRQVKKEGSFAVRQIVIVEYYLEGLKILADSYDDRELIQLITDFKATDLYIEAFQKSVSLAQKRQVADEKILKNKEEIDRYFRGDTK